MNPVVENYIERNLYFIHHNMNRNYTNNKKNDDVYAPQRAMPFFTTG